MKVSGEYKGGLQKGIAEILNVTKRQVAKYSSIEKLPPDVQQQVIDGTISINKAVEMTVSTHTDSESKNDSFIGSLSDLVSSLSETARNRILSGEVDLEALLSVSSEKDEPVHHFEPDNDTAFPKNEDTASENDEPVHHFEADSNTSPEFPDIQMQARSPSTESKSKENGSVLIFKDGMFIPNKIQVIEEHESYTVFKVFAVKQ